MSIGLKSFPVRYNRTPAVLSFKREDYERGSHVGLIIWGCGAPFESDYPKRDGQNAASAASLAELTGLAQSYAGEMISAKVPGPRNQSSDMARHPSDNLK